MPRHLAACYAHMRRLDEARAIIRQLRALPAVVIPDTSYVRNPEHCELFLSGLRLATGLRAGEIAKLTWPMLLDPDGRIANHIELHDRAAKKRSGRTIPLHPALRRELQRLRRHNGSEGAAIRSERSGSHGMRAGSSVNWFRQL